LLFKHALISSFSQFHFRKPKENSLACFAENFVFTVSLGKSKLCFAESFVVTVSLGKGKLCFVCFQLRREIAIAKRVSYDKHIVQFYGACTTVNGAWLCMELMEVRAACGD